MFITFNIAYTDNIFNQPQVAKSATQDCYVILVGGVNRQFISSYDYVCRVWYLT